MLNGMGPRRQLGEEENGDKKEMTQGIHGLSLVDLNEQTFEIFAFREVQGDRVIRCPGQTTDDARFTTRIMGRIGDDFLEQLEPDAAGARVSHQQATRLEQAETKQVDILVGTRRALGMGGRGRELGRVENYQVKLATGLAEIAQCLEDICLLPLGSFRRQLRVERQIGLALP